MSISTSLPDQVDATAVRSTLQFTDGKLRLQGGPTNAAWQHEMERVQFDNWFKPFDASAASTTNGNRPDQTASLPSHSSAAFPSPRLHLPAILKESELASDLDARSQSTIERTGSHHSMGGTGDAYVAQGDNSSAFESPVSSSFEVGNAPDLLNAFGAADRSKLNGALQSATTKHASNLPVAQLTIEQAPPRQVQIAVLSSARLLSEVSNPADTGLLSKTLPHEGAAEQLESSESVRRASAALAQGASVQAHTAASPVRLHVQWQGQTANIWLGMDGSAKQVSSQSQIVVAELQRHFAATGQRVGRIVCNGSVVFDSQLHVDKRSDSLFAAQVDAQMRVGAQVHHKLNSKDSEFPAHNSQEEI